LKGEFKMYQQVVRRVLASAFAGLNKGDIQAVTGKFAVEAEHYFIGQHALSGTRRTNTSIYRWYERLLRLFPDIQFQLHRIQVQGPPWRTIATVEWSETNTGTDGVRTHNEGVNVIELGWGKVRRVRIYTDTATLTNTLARLAAAGNREAAAPPIVDV
jgi:ketosteroid isomerase-like protein